jgi:energy-coupling factor transporter ATP-binding protein EcfA2
MVKLTSLSVTGLLGRFDHHVIFPEDWEFVILHGPNGVGKTKLLELVTAISAGRLHALFIIPFDVAILGFSDGTQLSIVRGAQLALETVGSNDEPGRLQVELARPNTELVRFSIMREELHPPEQRLRILERELPLERVDRETWFDHSNEDYLTLVDINRRYPGYLGPPSAQTSDINDAFTEFVRGFHVHLIETQRLLTFAPLRPGQRGPVRQSTAAKYAQDLTRRIREALAENSQTSQQLDRTFPRRVLEARVPDGVTDDQIRIRYAAQSELRDRLSEIAVLDTYASLPLPERDLEGWEQRVLWTYLEDTDQKLATFSQLLDRVGLLRQIVNSRFLFNEIHIDRESGFRFATPSGDQVGPEALSSGEQHELVLMYDLLFNVAPETTVLIDEPEISLHIAWQQRFLDDIAEISQVAALRFLVATHSPQIIHKWWSRTVPLYGEERTLPPPPESEKQGSDDDASRDR